MRPTALAPVSALLLACTTLLTGCGLNSLRAVTGGANAEGGRVIVEQTDGDIIKLVVLNESPMPMVVYRDLVTLSTRKGERRRTPNAWATSSVYTIEPSKSHRLNVRFDLSDLELGDKVELRMNDAVQIKGKPIQFPPIRFMVWQ